MTGGEAGVVERLRPIFATIAPGMTPRPGPPGAPGNPIRPGLEVPLEQALDVGTAMPANSLIPARPLLLAGWRSSPQPRTAPAPLVLQSTRTGARSLLAQGVTKAGSLPAPPIAVLTHRGSRTGGQLPRPSR